MPGVEAHLTWEQELASHQSLETKGVLLSQAAGIPRPSDVNVVDGPAAPTRTVRAGSMNGRGRVPAVHVESLGVCPNGEVVGLDVSFPQVVARLVNHLGLRARGRKSQK